MSDKTPPPIPDGPTCLTRLQKETIFVWTVLTTNVYLLGGGGEGQFPVTVDKVLLTYLLKPLNLDEKLLGQLIEKATNTDFEAFARVRGVFMQFSKGLTATPHSHGAESRGTPPWTGDGDHPSFAELRGTLGL